MSAIQSILQTQAADAQKLGHYRRYADMLCRHFSKRLVCDLNVEDISALQALRQNEGLSARSVNAEIGVLRQILKHHNSVGTDVRPRALSARAA